MSPERVRHRAGAAAPAPRRSPPSPPQSPLPRSRAGREAPCKRRGRAPPSRQGSGSVARGGGRQAGCAPHLPAAEARSAGSGGRRNWGRKETAGGRESGRERDREREGYRLQWCPAAPVSRLLLASRPAHTVQRPQQRYLRGVESGGGGRERERGRGREGRRGWGAARRQRGAGRARRLVGLGWPSTARRRLTGQSARRRLRASCNLLPSSPPAQEGGQDVSPTGG